MVSLLLASVALFADVTVIKKTAGVLPLEKGSSVAVIGAGGESLSRPLKNLGLKVTVDSAKPLDQKGAMSIVPPSVLFPDPPGEGKGLTARYFPNPVLMRGPVLLRTDAKLDFAWGNKAAGQDVPTDNFSVSWNGKIKSPVTGKVTFGFEVEGGVRMFLDGEKVVDDWKDKSRRSLSGSVSLVKGRTYSVVIHFCDEKGPSLLRFMWDAAVPYSTALAAGTVVVLLSDSSNKTELLKTLKAGGVRVIVVVNNKSRAGLSWIKPLADTVLGTTKEEHAALARFLTAK